jgi:hypothetical protein
LALSSETLEGIEKKTDRISLTDDFEKHVLVAAETLSQYWQAYQSGKQTFEKKTKKTLQPTQKETVPVTDAVMLEKFQALKGNAQKWLKEHEKKKGDKKTEEKRTECKNFIAMANLGIKEVLCRKVEALQQKEVLQQKVDGDEADSDEQNDLREAEADLKVAVLRQKVESGAANRDDQNAFREAEANSLAMKSGYSEAKGGSSKVQLIKGSKGNVKYAFKPLDGESFQNKGDTLREVVSSSMCRTFTELTKLDLGFPEVSVANIGGRGGALIEGIKGTEIPVEKSADLSDEDRSALDKMAADVPAEELQKVILSAVACSDTDIKWDNVFLADNGTKARRFDGGKGFPDKDSRANIILGEMKGESKILSTNDCSLLNTPFSKKPLKAAKAQMPKNLVKDFCNVKDSLTVLKSTMATEAATACQALSTDDKPQNLDVKAIEQTVRSIERAVAILEAKDPITTEEFYKAWASQRVLDMASDFLDDLKAEIDEFDSYDQTKLKQRLKEMKVTGDMKDSVKVIQQIISAGPDKYQDAMAQVLHDHFQVIDKLLAAFAYATVELDSSFVDELSKISTVTLPKPKKDKEGEKKDKEGEKKDKEGEKKDKEGEIPLDKGMLGDLVWSAMKKLNKEELRRALTKLGNLSTGQSSACARPGGAITIKIEYVGRNKQPGMGVVGPNVLALRIGDTPPADVLAQLRAVID